jgi:DNA-directed RNA polymerase
VDTAKQVYGIVPNFVHSMDSALIVNLVLELELPFVTIHDCFACHPNGMDRLRRSVFRTFANMYLNQDYIIQFYHDNLNKLHEVNIEIITEGVNKFIVHPESNALIPFPNLPKLGSKQF